MEFVSVYSSWYYFLCFLIAGIVTYFFYRKDKKLEEFSRYTIILPAFLRFILLGFLAVLLLAPLVKYITKTIEKPIIIVAQDNTSSIKIGVDSINYSENVENRIKSLVKELEKDYQVDSYLFSDELSTNSALGFDGRSTNFQNLFEELENKYVNQNVGGLVLVSDGIYNQGSNPVYMTNLFDFPVFSVAIGDTTKYMDAKLLKIRNNKLAFLGNDFPVEIELNVIQSKGQKVKVSITAQGKSVFTEELEINSGNFSKTVSTTLPAKRIGLQKYTVTISKLEGERNVYNNVLDFYIDVLDGRQKIALLSEAPHPDIAAIKRSIESNENYQLTIEDIEEFDEEVAEYDLLILHQSVGKTDFRVTPLIQKIVKTKIPVLLIGGGWNSVGIQFGISPFQGTQNDKNEVLPLLNPAFTLFTIGEKLQQQIVNFPPLVAERSKPMKGLGNSVLLFQKIGAVNTTFPLMEFKENRGRKIGRLYGENLWKWSMADYLENKSYKNFNALISKVVQFLAIKTDRSLFRVSTQNEYFENESIIFDAQLFNQSYELIANEEVSLKIKDQNNTEFPFVFNSSGNSYQLSINSLPAGEYYYEALVNAQGKEMKEVGRFLIKELQLEQIESVANHNLLYQLAEKTNGKMIYPQEIEGLAEILQSREDITSVSYLNEEVEDIINLKWIFFLLISLLSIEWFIRKRGGAY